MGEESFVKEVNQSGNFLTNLLKKIPKKWSAADKYIYNKLLPTIKKEAPTTFMVISKWMGMESSLSEVGNSRHMDSEAKKELEKQTRDGLEQLIPLFQMNPKQLQEMEKISKQENVPIERLALELISNMSSNNSPDSAMRNMFFQMVVEKTSRYLADDINKGKFPVPEGGLSLGS